MNKQDSKEMWKTIKQLVGDKSKQNQTGIKFKNHVETDEKVISEKFNNYFIDSIEAITNKIKKEDIDFIAGNIDNCNTTMCKFKLISLPELKKGNKKS